MSRAYQLGTLQLGTAFDEPIRPVTVPEDLNKKNQDKLAMIDGADRAPHRLARLVRPVSLLGVRLTSAEQTVSVAMNFLVDDLASLMWSGHTNRNDPDRKPLAKDEEPVLPDVSRRHRLVVVSAQGAPVAAAVLNLWPQDGGETRQRVAFEVPADLIEDNGLLMVGIDDADPHPWGGQAQMPDGSVGLGVINMRLDTLDNKPVRPAVVAGHTDEQGAVVDAATGYFVVNPGAGRPAYTVEMGVRGLGGDRLRGRRARVKHPARAARELAQDVRLDTSGTIHVEVQDLDGATVFTGEVTDGRVEVPAGTGPVLVRPIRRDAHGGPMVVDWWAKVRG